MYSVRFNNLRFTYSHSSLREVVSHACAYSAWLIRSDNDFRRNDNRLIIRSNDKPVYLVKGREIKRV